MVAFLSHVDFLGEEDHFKAIAKLGTYKQCIHMNEFRQMFLIIQGEYLRQRATQFKANVYFFPGHFVQLLKQNQELFKHSSAFRIAKVNRVNSLLIPLGCSLNALAELPVCNLVWLSRQKVWKKFQKRIFAKSRGSLATNLTCKKNSLICVNRYSYVRTL